MLVVFAHPLEAESSLKRLNAVQTSFNLWNFDGGTIVITGMGCCNAEKYTHLHGRSAKRILNLGIVGALHDHLPIGQAHTVASIGKLNEPLLHTEDEGWRLVTSDHPIWDKEERDQLGKEYDIVDMEGYGVASAATRLGVPYTLWKIISDQASEGGQADLKRRIAPLSEQLADFIRTR